MRTRLAVLAGGLLLTVIVGAPAAAQTSIQCDATGACYGTVNGQPFSGYKEGSGTVSGRVGTRNFTAYIDPFGNISGRIGERNVEGYVDAFGNGSLRYLDGRGADPDPGELSGPPQVRSPQSPKPPAATPRPSALPPRPVWDAAPAPSPREPVCYTTRQGRTICSKVR